MWTMLKSPKTVKVTKKNATLFANMDSLQMDRPLRQRRLDVYQSELAAANFRPVSWAKAYCEETETWYRINGHHTSTLFASVILEDYQELYAIVEEYQCPTLEDVSHLWSTFDSQTQTRNAVEVNRAFIATIPELSEFCNNIKLTSLVVGGLCYYRAPTTVGVLKNSSTLADRAELLFDAIEEYKWVASIIQDNNHARMLRRVPVIGCMIGTFKKSRRAATQFWEAVRDATGSTPSMPDRILNRWLIESTMIRDRSFKKKRTSKEFYVRSVNAWNAWRKDETTKRYKNTAKIPAFK